MSPTLATLNDLILRPAPETVNASIGRIRANARGFHTAQAFITMIMLDRAGIAPTLPWQNAS